MTLLELIVATTLLSAIVTSVAMLLRGGHTTWLAHEGDVAKIESAHATLRQIVRSVRQATSVLTITTPATTSGSLSVTMATGAVWAWAHDSGTLAVNYGVTTANTLLAEGIAELRFAGYKADGTTQTNVAAEVQLIKITALVQLPRETAGSRQVICWAWLRSW